MEVNSFLNFNKNLINFCITLSFLIIKFRFRQILIIFFFLESNCNSLFMDWFYLLTVFIGKFWVIVSLLFGFLMVRETCIEKNQFMKWVWESLGDFCIMLGYVSFTCRQNNGHYTEHFHDEEVWVSNVAWMTMSWAAEPLERGHSVNHILHFYIVFCLQFGEHFLSSFKTWKIWSRISCP